MRRASSSLLSHLTRCRTNSVFCRDFISDATPLPLTENPLPFSPSHLKSCKRTRGLLLFKNKKYQFQNHPSRNLDTLVEQSPHLSSRQRKIKEKNEIEEEFESATTTEEILRAFKDMESVFSENELGLACLKVGLKLDQEGTDPEKSLDFANRALKILDRDNKVSLSVAMTLHLMGSASYKLKKFNDSLGYLNRANRILGRLEEEGYDASDIRPVLHAVQLDLANTKTAMGRREEALGNLRKCLELKEMALEADSRELGIANRDLAEAYVAVLNFKEALPFCLKALEIHKAQLGNNSVEVAHDRRLLGVIYCGLEEHEKALEQNELSQKVLKNWGLSSDLLRAEIDAANMQIALGKYDEAINTLKGVVQQTDKESENRALVFISMAKALCNQEKFADSKRCLEISCGILDKKETVSPIEVAEAYMDVSLGPHHADSIEACQNLSKAYAAMGSYALAMEFQQRVIDAWESHGPSARDEYREAHRLLEQLKNKARGSPSTEVLTKALPLPQTSELASSRGMKPEVCGN
uniref:Uncharacterized protein n=1 Tax=Nelumbo nucifera TaxID=4432 RepID=A0A822XJI3_NELNU|nr:TPA_asm: hypothetical protein HUJ06_021326 [Nelumbo nucifera]